jgi:hypothetical protein
MATAFLMKKHLVGLQYGITTTIVILFIAELCCKSQILTFPTCQKFRTQNKPTLGENETDIIGKRKLKYF